MIYAQNESQVKVLMSGYKCYGWWKTCTVDKCLDMPVSTALGDQPLPPLSTWRNCNYLTSEAKLISKACVYDQQLYDSTAGHLGCVCARVCACVCMRVHALDYSTIPYL